MDKLFLKIKVIMSILRGGEGMLILLLVDRIIMGENTFEEMPDSLKPAIYAELVKAGLEFLANGWTPEGE